MDPQGYLSLRVTVSHHVGSVVPGRHRELRHHEEDIRRELRSYTDHGWFTAVARAAKLRWFFIDSVVGVRSLTLRSPRSPEVV